MALVQKLLLRQTQALVMTPQLMQAIKLLQLSHVDLASYVEDEIERNPLLERPAEQEPDRGDAEDRAGLPAPAAQGAADADLSDGEGGWTEGQLDGRLENARQSAEERFDSDSDTHSDHSDLSEAAPAAMDALPGDYSPWAAVGPGGRSDGVSNLEAYVAAETTLASHLAGQVSMAFADPVDRVIAQYLVNMVDDTGYIGGPLTEVAEKLGAPRSRVEAVLVRMQTFDPSGVCARNLTECLAIQLRERNRLDPAMEALLGRLDLLARRDLAALRKICGVNDEDLADMIAEIKRLNPKPGLAFGSAVVQPIVPDVFVRQSADGAFVVELNHDTLPKVLVNQTYYSKLSKTAKNNGDKSYFTDCLQTGTWLVRALDQRAKTILKVASEIVRQQEGFFVHGVEHLRPLNLKGIADAIEMHESTVSRVTANKYLAASRGIFEMKFFFTSAIDATNGGEAHSAAAVRHRIRGLIEAEHAGAVLSDDAIVARLRSCGIDIARRTVAKYREAMRIPSSVQRRRDKATVKG